MWVKFYADNFEMKLRKHKIQTGDLAGFFYLVTPVAKMPPIRIFSGAYFVNV